MQQLDEKLLYSATDLVHFLACRHHTYLDLFDLEEPLPRTEVDPETELVQEKGEEHERLYLQHLKDSGRHVVEIPSGGALVSRAEATRAAMASGAEVVYYPCFPAILGPGQDEVAGLRWLGRYRTDGDRADVHEADYVRRGGEPERSFHTRVIRGGAGPP